MYPYFQKNIPLHTAESTAADPIRRFLTENPAFGTLIFQVTGGQGAFPVAGATVTITKPLDERLGISVAVTTDESGTINFPYLYAKGRKPGIYDEKKRFSFCCTLLTTDFLQAFDFHLLDASKNWFDVTISHESINHGFHNYLFINLPVLHRPHGSRPWKQLKYTNPLKYYWLKFTKGLDKI